jgi:mRNA-degrading endonuclease RelE of RelBE toxin-antitoxin system
MEFRIADTFTDSLARLTRDEQKAAKTTAFDLQINPANPGMSFHKLDKAKDKNFWSVRVNKDIRLIVHKNEGSLLLCYVAHHDNAYDWAERRKLEIHPKTGAAQLVEIRETVKEVFVPVYIQPSLKIPVRNTVLFENISDDELLGYGVPIDWLKDVKHANEDTMFALADHLPAEAAEALLELATGGKPRVTEFIGDKNPFIHPDAQRRFRIMNNLDELQLALDAPWDKWAVFLHPDQQQLITRDYSGPSRISGSAGTGKTIVALHRAVFLAKANPDSRILFTTFSEILANSIKVKLRRLISNEPSLSERLEVSSINEIGIRLYKANIGKPNIISEVHLNELIKNIASHVKDQKFSQSFLFSEWQQVADAWQLETWEDYRDVKRLGRKTRLPEQQRIVLWSIFSQVKEQLNSENLITMAGLFTKLGLHVSQQNKQPFDFSIIDEAQDISPYHLRFLSALSRNKPNALFFAGDLGQRIFNQPFSWKAVGVDIRGRSKTLQVNYRTSHQIRKQADLLLASEVSDVDGNLEERKNTVSIFNGPPPEIRKFSSITEESLSVSEWISKRIGDGIALHEIGVFVRSSNEINRAITSAEQAKVKFIVLDEKVETIGNCVSISTMHLAKGLEFKAVAVMACDDEIIPSQERIEGITDSADLVDVYNTERHLLYVACTRARDYLLITSVQPASEFLEDMKG